MGIVYRAGSARRFVFCVRVEFLLSSTKGTDHVAKSFPHCDKSLSFIACRSGDPLVGVGGQAQQKARNRRRRAIWKNLPGTDGKDHSLADFKDAKLLVVVFTCNRCPVARAYEDRLIAVQKDFSAKGVQLVAINCNTDDADALPAMKQRATDKAFEFPYLFDETQQSGRDYGATVTPHVFVLDAARKIVYMGVVDDNINSDAVKQHYLADTLDACSQARQSQRPRPCSSAAASRTTEPRRNGAKRVLPCAAAGAAVVFVGCEPARATRGAGPLRDAEAADPGARPTAKTAAGSRKQPCGSAWLASGTWPRWCSAASGRGGAGRLLGHLVPRRA